MLLFGNGNGQALRHMGFMQRISLKMMFKVRHGMMTGEKKADRRVVKTKKAIRNAFAELLMQKELHEITIKDIAETADINRKTFYAHYAGVYQVVDEIENDIVSEFGALLLDADLNYCIKNPHYVFQKLTAIINGNIEFYGNLMRMSKNSSLVSKIVKEMKESLKHSFAAQIHMNPSDIDAVSDFIISGMFAVFQSWFHSDRKQSLEELSDTVSVIAMLGLNGLIEQTQNRRRKG